MYRDFTRGLGNRGIKLYFYDARVEGSNAIESIVTGVQWFNQNTSDVEALVIARGGGSLEQLQPFNSIEVAKAIYGSRIPVMTAIGHETDVTIADLVADVRASVPMDAGKRLGAAWEKAEERIRAIEHNISAAFRSRCREFASRLHPLLRKPCQFLCETALAEPEDNCRAPEEPSALLSRYFRQSPDR